MGRFDSDGLCHASVAHLAERSFETRQVAGAIPARSTNFQGRLKVGRKALDLAILVRFQVLEHAIVFRAG